MVINMYEDVSITDSHLAIKYIKRRVQNSNCPFKIRVVGNSMLPTIKNGDIIEINSYKGTGIKIGDIVCYCNELYLVIHRVIQIYNKNNTIYYKVKGDNMDNADLALITQDQILGHYTEKTDPFINIYYPNNKTINIVTELIEIKQFVIKICAREIWELGYRNNKTELTVIVYKDKDMYILEAFNDMTRERYTFYSLPEIKGQLYAVLFNADAFDNMYHNYIVFHAGGVLIRNELVGVIGKTGHGKSTLLYHLAKQGYTYLGDEKLYICPKNETIEIQPFYSPIMLRNDIKINDCDIERVEATIVKKMNCSERKNAIGIDLICQKIIDGHGIFIIPVWAENIDFNIRVLNSQEAFITMVKNLRKGNNVDASKIKKISKIISKFKYYEIRYTKIEECLSAILHIVESKNENEVEK